MNKTLAETLTENMLYCAGRLDWSVALVSGVLTVNLYLRYRAKVGETMADIHDSIFRVLWEEHPDLEPDWLKPGTKAPERNPRNVQNAARSGTVDQALVTVRQAIGKIDDSIALLRLESVASSGLLVDNFNSLYKPFDDLLLFLDTNHSRTG